MFWGFIRHRLNVHISGLFSYPSALPCGHTREIMSFWPTLSDMSSEETFSINGAAKLTGYSLPTIRKRLPELQKAGAVQVDGRWAIPLSALYACGLMSKVEGFSKPDSNPLQSETVNEIETLRAELSEALKRAEVAEAVAAERAAALERADRAMLAIEASAATKRRGWRLFRAES